MGLTVRERIQRLLDQMENPNLNDIEILRIEKKIEVLGTQPEDEE